MKTSLIELHSPFDLASFNRSRAPSPRPPGAGARISSRAFRVRWLSLRFLVVVSSGAFLFSAPAGHAEVVLFNGFSHSYDDPVTGAPLVFVSGDARNVQRAYVPGAGPGGATAVVLSTDFAGTGWGQVDYEDRHTNVTGNASANLGDYTLSFDAASNVPHAAFWLVVGTQVNGSPSTASVLLYCGAASIYQHYTLNLGSDLSGSPPLSPLSRWWQLDFNLMSTYFADPSVGNRLSLANVQLSLRTQPPSLAITRTATNTLVISWPSPSSGFVLQTNSTLSPTNWGDLSVTPADDGTTKSVIASPTSSLFYRLTQ